MLKCELCGKLCKNQRGLAIHQGHMHKFKDEFQVLQQEVQELKVLVRQLLADKSSTKTHDTVRWLPIPTVPVFDPVACTSYGSLHSDLMQELKLHFST